MSQKPAAAKRVRVFADAMEMDAGQVLTPADFDAIAKVIHSELTELRTNSKCGAMGFAGVAAALACNLLSARQLAAFAQGLRQNDINEQMRTIATQLTPGEMHALAAFYGAPESARVANK
jgi:hypothetical protein